MPIPHRPHRQRHHGRRQQSARDAARGLPRPAPPVGLPPRPVWSTPTLWACIVLLCATCTLSAGPVPIGDIARQVRPGGPAPTLYQGNGAIEVLVEFGIASWFYSHAQPEPVDDPRLGVRDRLYPLAHKTLPFGTLVKVINPRNGQKILGRVVDRGPFIAGRIIDLDAHSARALGISGIGPIILKIFKRADAPMATPRTPQPRQTPPPPAKKPGAKKP